MLPKARSTADESMEMELAWPLARFARSRNEIRFQLAILHAITD